MSEPKVSIIIPMYNVEKYLDTCVQSVRKQTLQNIEIILVDDGSPDCCGDMAEKYANQDSRIRVVHRENGGLGPARNSGMDVATGEYIGFVDSDDWVEPQMFEELYAAATQRNADICFSGMQCMIDGVKGDRNVNPFADQVLKGQEEIFRLRRSFYGPLPNRQKWDPVPVSVWTAVYRRSLIADNNLRFRNIRSEDKFFNTAACKAASVVTAIGETRYNYRCDGQSSITRTFSERMVDSYLELFRELLAMAGGENPTYQNECLLRARRGVIDYTRVACQTIAGSHTSQVQKSKAMRKMVDDVSVCASVVGYPFWKLPIPQAVFAGLLRMKATWLMLSLAGLKVAL